MSAASHLSLLETLARVGAGLLFALAALALGDGVLALAERVLGTGSARAPTLTRFGTSLLAGFGAAACVGVALGLARVFYWPLLLAAGAAAVALRRSALLGYARALSLRGHLLTVAAATAAAVVFAASWLAALLPPTGYDELAYHLPEAQQVAREHTLHLTTGAFYGGEHPLFGNLPKLAEVLYAEGVAFGGVELARSLHLLVLGAFLLLAAGVVRELLGAGAAGLGVLLVLLHDELLVNASSGYVDAASASFEAGAVLVAALWLERGGRERLAHVALLAGFALGVKYSAAFTALFLAVTLAVFARRWWSTRAGIALGGLAVAAGGFWYLKNLVRLGNPLYPFYLGHEGIGESEHRSLVADVKGFRWDRTPADFLRFPSRRWQLVDALPTFAAVYLTPVAALVPRARRALALLTVYAIGYAAWWYFVSSHQTRFLLAAIVVSLLLLAATACHLQPLSVRIAVLAGAAVVFGSLNPYTVEHAPLTWPAELEQTVRTDEVAVALGLDPVGVRLRNNLGCGIEALWFLHARGERGVVLDHWSRWTLPSLAVYEAGTPLRSLPARDLGDGELQRELDRLGARFLFVNESSKTSALGRTEPHVREATLPHARLERRLLRDAEEIWRDGDCRLYRL
jgi:hypothetical protein